MSEKICFFTFVSDNYFYPIGAHKLINSFKRFHPDIDLVVFRQDMVDYVFEKYGYVNWLNAKPTFAKLLTDKYDLIINIDADTVILHRLDEVLEQNYDICTVWNFNDFMNVSVDNVSEEEYVHAGFVGARKKEFWDIWELANRDNYMYKCAENDVLALIWKNNPTMKNWRKRIFDRDKDYWGCKSLGKEKEFYMKDGKVMYRNEIVKAYHHAKGPNAMPKLVFDKMGFQPAVAKFMEDVSMCGNSITVKGI